MKKIIALGGSNSKNSINKTLAVYVANKVANSETIVVDLNDFNLPLYSIDLETSKGIPEEAIRLDNLINTADGVVISLAEHNGSYSVAFKNAYDWMSRIDKNVWKDKPMLLMATSPGGRGGASVLQAANASFPRLGAKIVADFSLPSFYDNFSNDGLTNEALSNDLKQKIDLLQEAL